MRLGSRRLTWPRPLVPPKFFHKLHYITVDVIYTVYLYYAYIVYVVRVTVDHLSIFDSICKLFSLLIYIAALMSAYESKGIQICAKTYNNIHIIIFKSETNSNTRLTSVRHVFRYVTGPAKGSKSRLNVPAGPRLTLAWTVPMLSRKGRCPPGKYPLRWRGKKCKKSLI